MRAVLAAKGTASRITKYRRLPMHFFIAVKFIGRPSRSDCGESRRSNRWSQLEMEIGDRALGNGPPRPYLGMSGRATTRVGRKGKRRSFSPYLASSISIASSPVLEPYRCNALALVRIVNGLRF